MMNVLEGEEEGVARQNGRLHHKKMTYKRVESTVALLYPLKNSDEI